LVLQGLFEAEPEGVVFGKRLLGLNKCFKVELSFCIEVGNERVKLLLNGGRVCEEAFLLVIDDLSKWGL
jgi:hypothetical protein